jgi:hypothetical protein
VLVVCRAAVALAAQPGKAARRERDGALRQVVLRRRKHLGALEHQRRGDVHEALHSAVERRADHRAVQRVFVLDLRVRERCPGCIDCAKAREMDHLRAALQRRLRLRRRPQVRAADLARLAHPLWRGALV